MLSLHVRHPPGGAARGTGGRAPQGSGAVYVAVVRNTPLLIVLIFFRIAAPKIGIQFTWVDIVWGDIRT